MLNALWLVVSGMAIIFVVLAILWLAMVLAKKFVPAEKKQESNKP
ncbi:MAG: OadG family protein [Chloroflexota bacterium]